MIESLYIDDLQIHGAAGYRVEAFDVGSPAPRAVALARPSDQGAIDATAFYGPRSIQLVGTVIGTTAAELWAALDDLKGALSLGASRVLRFRREGLSFDERCDVRVDSSLDVPLAPSNVSPVVRWGVSLFAADPRFYSNTLNTGAYDPTDSGPGGLSFPLAFPLVFDAAAGAGSLSVDNEGTVSAPAVFTITGPVTNPTLDNDTTSQSVYFAGADLASGDTLSIDSRARAVTLNGTTLRPDLIDPILTDWFDLAPGVNLLRLRGLGMVATETELSVSFRNARI